MSNLPLIFLAFATFALSAWLTGRFRAYALRRSLLDVPNARSSHAIATPRGGGVGFVVASIAAFVALGCAERVSWALVLGLVAAGILVAVVGFIDDVRSIPARYRLLAHFGAAGMILAVIWRFAPNVFARLAPVPSWLALGLAAVLIVWLLNLTNFMDGIDGLAGSEGVTVFLAAAGLQWSGDVDFALPLMMGAAVAGFVLWNWPPAKIFMGDIGSGYLGLVLGSLMLYAAMLAPALFWAWLILMGCFIVDATLTLVRRVARGEKFYEAHRTHAYQHAARQAGAHRSVTVVVVAINLFWLLPLAWLVARGTTAGLWTTALAYGPLCVLAIRFRAGAAA
jgi:Fuc2NAc and GlcNAc transferase